MAGGGGVSDRKRSSGQAPEREKRSQLDAQPCRRSGGFVVTRIQGLGRLKATPHTRLPLKVECRKGGVELRFGFRINPMIKNYDAHIGEGDKSKKGVNMFFTIPPSLTVGSSLGLWVSLSLCAGSQGLAFWQS